MENKWKGLSVNEATTLGMFMDHANYHKEIHMRDKAFLSLIDIKQDMIDDEDYERLAELRQLEEWHNIAIPFIVYS
tara:strand:- start:443 stop:670 length:228 start_codon:yes stop_codon:yes gene_type:complete